MSDATAFGLVIIAAMASCLVVKRLMSWADRLVDEYVAKIDAYAAEEDVMFPPDLAQSETPIWAEVEQYLRETS